MTDFLDSHSTLDPETLREVMQSSLYLMDYEVVAREPHSSLTRLGRVGLDTVDIFRFDGHGLRCSDRHAEHIRRDHIADYLLCIPLTGEVALTHEGSTLTLLPGQFAIADTSLPFRGTLVAHEGEDFSCYGVRVAGASLGNLVPRIEDCCDRSIAIRRGFGKLMESLFELALNEGGHLPANQVQQLGTMLLQSIAYSLLDAPELLEIKPRLRASAQAVSKARMFIEGRLADPGLGIVSIAQHCNVSIRSLQGAFAATSLTPVLYIQERRLQRCREALRDPRLRHQSITEIGLNWGFESSSYFSRLYKKRFGRSPSDERAATA